MSKNKHIIYVYGTLRPNENKDIALIPGVMYDLGWFPGVKLDRSTNADGPLFLCERIEVTDERLAELDSYEGYYPENPDGSLYLRVPMLDGWIYEYNGSVTNHKVIESGNWQEYSKEAV